MADSIDEIHGVLKNLQDSLVCPICRDLLDDPARTRCGHYFCTLCVSQLTRKRPTGCPLCKVRLTRRSYASDPLAAALVEQTRDLVAAISQDTGFDVSPSKYRPRQSVEANDIIQETTGVASGKLMTPRVYGRGSTTPADGPVDADGDLLSISQRVEFAGEEVGAAKRRRPEPPLPDQPRRVSGSVRIGRWLPIARQVGFGITDHESPRLAQFDEEYERRCARRAEGAQEDEVQPGPSTDCEPAQDLNRSGSPQKEVSPLNDDDDKENHWEEVQAVEEKSVTPGIADKRIFKTRSPQVPQIVRAASTSVEAAIEADDPYQFISSQKTPPKKKQRKSRAVKKLGTDVKAKTRKCPNKKSITVSGGSNNQEETVASTSGNLQPDEPVKEKKKHVRQAAKKPIPAPALFVDCEDSPMDDSQEDPSFVPEVSSHRPKSKLGRQTVASASKPKMVTGKQLLGGANSGTASQEVRAIGELFDNVAQVACTAAQTRDRSVLSTSMTRAESLRQLDIEAATARQPETPRSVTFSERVDVCEFGALSGSSPSVADRSATRVTSDAAEHPTESSSVVVDKSVPCITASAAEPSTDLTVDDAINEPTQGPRRSSAATSPGWSKLPGLETAFGIKSKLCVTGGCERTDGVDQSRMSLERTVTQETDGVSPSACIQEVTSDVVSSSDAEESAGFELKDIELAAEKALRCRKIISETCENARVMPNYSSVRVVVETPASDRASLTAGECASDDCAIASGPMMSESPTSAVQPQGHEGPGLEAMEVELCADFDAGTVSSGVCATTEGCNQSSVHLDSDDRQKLSGVGAVVLPHVSVLSRKSTSSMDITAGVSCDVRHQSSAQCAEEVDSETAVCYSTAEKSAEIPKMTAIDVGCRQRSTHAGSPQAQLSDPITQQPSSTGPRGRGKGTGNHRRHRPTNYSRQLRQLVRNQRQLTAVVTEGFGQLLSLLRSRNCCAYVRSLPTPATAVPPPLTSAERYFSAGVSVPPAHSGAISGPILSQSFGAKRVFSRSAPVSPSLVQLTDRLLDGGAPIAVSATAASEAVVGVVDHSPGGDDVVPSSAGEPTQPLGLTALLMERPFVPSAPVSSAGLPPTISVTQMERVADEMAVELVEAAAPPDSGPPVGSEEMQQCELYDAELAANDGQPDAGSVCRVAEGCVDDCGSKRPSSIDEVALSGGARRSSGGHKRTSSVSSVASSKSPSAPQRQVDAREDVDCKRPRLMSEEHCDGIIDDDNQDDAVMRTPVRPGSSPSSHTASKNPDRRETCDELGGSSPSGVCGNDWQDDVFSPASTPVRLETGSRSDSASDAMVDGGVCRLTPSHGPVSTRSSRLKQSLATTGEPSDVEVRSSKQQRVSSVTPASPYAGLRRSLGRSSLLPSPAAASPLEHCGSGVARGNSPATCSPRRGRRSSVRRSIADASDVSSASPLLRVDSHRCAQLTSDDIDVSHTTPLSASPLQRMKPRRHPQVISEDLDDTPGSPLSVFSIEDAVDVGDDAPVGEGVDGRNVSILSAASAQEKTGGMLDDTEMIQMVDNCKDPVGDVMIVESDDELPSPAPAPFGVSRDRSLNSRSRSPHHESADDDESKNADSVEGNLTMLDDEADVFSDTVPASPAEQAVASLQHTRLRQNGHDAPSSVARAVEETPDDVADADEHVLQDPSTQDMEIPDGFFNDSVIGPSGKVSDIPRASRAEASDDPAAAGVSEHVVQRLTAPVKPPRASMTAAAGGPPKAEAVAVAVTDGDGCISEAESEEMFLASRPTVDPQPARRPPVVVVSGLKRAELEAVQRLLASHSGRFCKTWEDSVTHVVVKTAENLEAGRTLKYLQGVASGSWVVSYCWVADSLEAGELLDESRYEALDAVSSEGGARRSRLRQQDLFKGFTFCCVEPFRDVTLEQLQGLIRLSGGLIVDSLSELADQQRTGTRLIVAQDDLDVDFEQWRRDYGAACVAYEWLVDCVATYRPWSLLDTTLCGATAAELSAMAVPDQWCQPETQDTVFFDTMGL